MGNFENMIIGIHHVPPRSSTMGDSEVSCIKETTID
ncbi:hypothetical protein CCACVL1_30531 [Corchorus capsularis]|uniref:Uncharacterized protein n=1 Tax=Corchorus capsularis TaxID=210143 RepID=A0A1R3FWP7_COCAP|nr:hypothetical protein CCACVL1_30531 [Corchorus capsularis]